MDTEKLEKQFSVWTRLMYVALGSAVTLLASSFDQFLGVTWFVIQILLTFSSFFLLWGKRWKVLPLSKERLNTIFGYFLASWLSLFAPLVLSGGSVGFVVILFVYSLVIAVVYWQSQKKLSDSEEMFP